jgi:acyl-CoA thioester hydrolase
MNQRLDVFEASIIRVAPEWVDRNGHMNVAFYLHVFDLAGGELFGRVGLGQAYVAQGTGTTFTLETRVRYVQEVFEGDPLRITGHIADVSEKLVHLVGAIHHAEKGYLAAEKESVIAHINQATRRTAPFPLDLYARLRSVQEAQRHLGRPKAFERLLGIKR